MEKKHIQSAIHSIRKWSMYNAEARKLLKPDLGLRSWNMVTIDEKELIWEYLKQYFPVSVDYDIEYLATRYLNTIYRLNQNYKAHSFGKNFLQEISNTMAVYDFKQILLNRSLLQCKMSLNRINLKSKI